MSDPSASGLAEEVEEAPQRGPVSALRGPQQPTSVVVHHDRQIRHPTPVGDLVDTDPRHAFEPVDRAAGVRPDPGDDRPDRAPRDPHQSRRRGLRGDRRQPRDGVVERMRMARVVPGPRNGRHSDPMRAAGHPGRVGLHERLHRSQVQSPPAPTTCTLIEPRAAPLARPASATTRRGRPHVHHHDRRVLIEHHVLDDRVLQPHQGTPYPCLAHAVLSSPISGPQQPEIYCESGVRPFTANSRHPQVRQESLKPSTSITKIRNVPPRPDVTRE